MNKMVARKTIVSLVRYLLIGWAVWIIVNFIEKTVSAWCPGHFYWKNMLSQEYIDILWDELNNTDFCFFKKVFYCPQGLAAAARPWGRCTPVSPPPTSWSRPPPRRRSTSAPPWITLVVVRIILAWCHSFFEFNSSPLWFEMNVPSSTSIVNGFW